MRIAESERAMLRELAERDGISSSDVVRVLIRRAHAAAFGRPQRRSAPKRSAKKASARKGARHGR